MLHLAIICIVCAVSALNEAFTERKNNESNIFCQYDGGGGDQNVGNVTSQNVYNVAVRNSSDRAEQTITNKTNSFFYDYIVNQYLDKNSTCSIMESVPLRKKFSSNVISPVRKKRNRTKVSKKYSAKTLRPPLTNEVCVCCDDPKLLTSSKERKLNQCIWSLKPKEKKMLFCLKKCKGGLQKTSVKSRKRHLDRLKVDDDLDLNKRIEKLVKEIALENQRKENSGKDLESAVSDDTKPNDEGSDSNNNAVPEKKVHSFPFFSQIKKIFGFSKDYFNSKWVGNDGGTVNDDDDTLDDDDGSLDNAAHSYDVLKTIRRTTRYRRNPDENHIRTGRRKGPNSVHKNTLNENDDIEINERKWRRNHAHLRHRRHRKKRITFCRKNRKKCKDRDYPMRIRLGLQKEPRLKRGGKTTIPGLEVTSKQHVTTPDPNFLTSNPVENRTAAEAFEEVLATQTDSAETTSSSLETKKLETTTENDDTTDDYKDYQTLEKSLVGRDSEGDEFGKQMYSDGNPMTEPPVPPPSDKYKYELKRKYLTPERYLKIRHALRTYLVHNNIFPIKKRSVKRKKKSCDDNGRPYKCWRSAPLLCLPYIKKCEEDQIRYLIRILQGMLGKPYPQKVGIFDKTKFKPHLRRPENLLYQMEDVDNFECLTKQILPRTDSPPVQNCPPCPSTIIPFPLTVPPSCPCENQNNQPWDFNPIQTGPPFTFPAMEGSTTVCNYDEFTTAAPPCEFTSNPCPLPPLVNPPSVATLTNPAPVNPPPSATTTPPAPAPAPSSCSPGPKPVVTTPSQPQAISSNSTSFSVTSCPLSFNLNAIQPQVVPQTTTSSFREPPIPSKFYGLNNESPILHNKEYIPMPNFHLEPPSGVTSVPPNAESTTTTIKLPNIQPNDSEQQLHPVKEKSNSQYILPNVEQPPEWSFTTTTSTPKENHLSQPGEGTKNYKPRYKSEYYFEPKIARKNVRQRLDDQKHNMMWNSHRENQRRLEGTRGYAREFYPDEDQLYPPLNYDSLQNRLFRMRHKGTLRKKPLHMRLPPPDYDFLNFPPSVPQQADHPRMIKHKSDNANSEKFSQDNAPRKTKRRGKRINSKRYKRGDDYYYEKFENYNDYLDPGYEEQNFKQAESNIFGKAPPDVIPPPAYEMFSELAKAVTATEAPSTNTFTNTMMVPAEIINTSTNTTKIPATTINTSTNTMKIPATTVSTLMNTTKIPATTPTSEVNTNTLQVTEQIVLYDTSRTLVTLQNNLTDQITKTNLSVGKANNVTEQNFNASTTGSVTPEIDFSGSTEEFNNGTESTEDMEKKSKKTTNIALLKTTTQIKPTDGSSHPDFGATEANSKIYIKTNKVLQGSQEDDLTPTTLKMASIAKGPKKLATKPSPKVYSKVYPDSLCNGEVTTETIATTKTTTAKIPRAKTTPSMSSSSPADLKLQMLAVCEGYLEVVKLIKAQNRTLGEELDMTLARYCESVISQSFNSQSEKPKTNEPSLQWSGNPELKSGQNAELYERQVRGNVNAAALENPENDKKDYGEGNETAVDKMSDSERKEGRRKDSGSVERRQKNQQSNEDADELLKKGLSREQIDLIELLNKRKKALMSWLMNSKESIKSGDGRDTEYFDDGDFVDSGPDLPQYSALLLTSTYGPDVNPEETELVGSNGYENEDLSEIQLKSEGKAGFVANAASNTCLTTTETSKTIVPATTAETPKGANLAGKNTTVTFISKPDPSTIVGTPPKENNTTHTNNTRKPSHRFGVAKDIFQEYSIEFLDYAVYILPVMFTILFLFCCLCCAVHILNTRKKHKKRRKKKERSTSTDETTETTEDSESEEKTRKRECKRRRKSEDGDDIKKRNKKFWNVLKIHPLKCDAEENPSEHKKKFLKFLKGKKEEKKSEPDSEESKPPETDEEYSESRRNLKEDKTDEAAERRELIALLEELKKIETENCGEKKEVKSVHVQYMTQEEENSVFRGPDFSYPYEKNVFGLPKGYSFCSKEFPFQPGQAAKNYELFEDVDELTELLPCDCRNDILRPSNFRINQEGRCERFLKVYRDCGVNRTEPFVDKSESENRRFVFNKYRGICTEPNEELLGVTQKNVGTENTKNAAFLQEMENFKRQLNKKKQVRLKDDGVLCRL